MSEGAPVNRMSSLRDFIQRDLFLPVFDYILATYLLFIEVSIPNFLLDVHFTTLSLYDLSYDILYILSYID